MVNGRQMSGSTALADRFVGGDAIIGEHREVYRRVVRGQSRLPRPGMAVGLGAPAQKPRSAA